MRYFLFAFLCLTASIIFSQGTPGDRRTRLDQLNRSRANNGDIVKFNLSTNNWEPAEPFSNDSILANEGTSKGINGIGLGQPLESIGDPAIFTEDREIPLDRNTLFFRKGDIQSTADFQNNIILNGNFSSGFANWYNTSGFFITSSGVNAVQPELGTRNRMSQDLNLTGNKLYVLSFTISNYVSGGVFVDVGGTLSKEARANGLYSEFITSSGDSTISIQAASGMNLVIDNIVLREVNKNQLTVEGNIYAKGSLQTDGIIYTGKNKRILIGNWDNGLDFKYDFWHPNEVGQPSVVIGENAMPKGAGVAVGSLALSEQDSLGYSTAVGTGAGQRNKSGHISVFGTKAGQSNVDGDVSVFGDEALASSTTGANDAFGYYALNLTQTADNAVFGYQGARLNINGHRTGFGGQIFSDGNGGLGTGFGYRYGQLLSTGGRLTGGGYNAARNATNARALILGHQAGEYVTSARAMTIIGDFAGGGLTTSPATDTLGTLVGFNARRTPVSSTQMSNYAAFGGDATVDESNKYVFGNNQVTKNVFFGNLGIGADPTNLIRGTKSFNGNEAINVDNPNSGTSTTMGLTLDANGAQGIFRQHNLNHPVWPGTLFIASSSSASSRGMTFFTSHATSPIDFWVAGNRNFILNSNRQMTLPAYTSSTSFTGTPTGNLSFTSTGAVITTPNIVNYPTYAGATSTIAQTAAVSGGLVVGSIFWWDDNVVGTPDVMVRVR